MQVCVLVVAGGVVDEGQGFKEVFERNDNGPLIHGDNDVVVLVLVKQHGGPCAKKRDRRENRCHRREERGERRVKASEAELPHDSTVQ
jgi:hypothetical protein